MKYAILTISDSASRGEREDVSGRIIEEMMSVSGAELVRYEIVPDNAEDIKQKLIDYSDNLKVDILLTTGGTGLSVSDVTPEATKAVIDKEVIGIAEAIRYCNFSSTKRVMLSRATAGVRKNTLIINLPGSPKGVRESLNIIIDILDHAVDMMYNKGH